MPRKFRLLLLDKSLFPKKRSERKERIYFFPLALASNPFFRFSQEFYPLSSPIRNSQKKKPFSEKKFAISFLHFHFCGLPHGF